MSRVLLSWFGTADLKASRGEAGAGLGPVAQALAERAFDHVVLISSYGTTEAAQFETWLQKKTKAKVVVRVEKLRSPTDYADIYRVVSKTLGWIRSQHADAKLTFHLSPGTPAMATVWILVAPQHEAELLQSSKERGVETANLPFEIAAEFVPALVRQGDAELERVAEGAQPVDPSFAHILHRSDAVKRLLEKAKQAAAWAAPILIEGESGTGKELLAAAIHKASGRKGRFVPVNCGALPRELVESTFFGHVKGSFSGAVADQTGRFEQATEGTLFLDEIGELPPDAQVKLLRVLQEKKVQRIGGKAEIPVNVRVIAATNRNLLAEVEAGRFREDLYFRLAILPLRTPPLREREGDVLLLIEQQLTELNADRSAAGQKKLSANAKSLLLRHPWPGNIRELQATVLRAFVWSKGGTIDEAIVREALIVRTTKQGDVLDRPLGEGFKLEELLEDVARHYLSRAMKEAGGVKKKAASLVGLASYQTLTNWLDKYEVEG